MKKKHIGFYINTIDGLGGSEKVTCSIASGLAKRGYDVSILSRYGSDQPQFKLDDNVHISVLMEKNPNFIRRKQAAIQTLREQVKRQSIDVLVVVDTRAFLLAWMACSRFCSLIAWEMFNYTFPKGIKRKFARHFAARKADAVVVLTHRDENMYRKHVSCHANIHCIYNPFIPSELGPANHSIKRVISVGRLDPIKGFDRLLNVWKLVEDKVDDWQLQIIGSGSQEQVLKAKVKDDDLKRVVFVPFQKDISAFYRQASIYVLGSHYEGLGMVLLEAADASLPIVSFDVREGPKELLKDGFLIPDGDSECMADCLLHLMQDESLRIRMGKKSQAILKPFDYEDVLNRWEKLIWHVSA